jgi:hypothetical protein
MSTRILVILLVFIAVGQSLCYAKAPVVTASSTIGAAHYGDFPPANAFDGESWTRWCGGGGQQYLQIDFGEILPIDDISIVWQFSAYATDYDIVVSDNGKDWKIIDSVKDYTVSYGGETEHKDLNAQGRIVRISLKKGPQWTYSIWEVRFTGDAINKKLHEIAWPVIKRYPEKLKKSKSLLKDEYGVEEIIFAMRKPYIDYHWYANIGYYALDETRRAYRKGGYLCKLNLTTDKLTVIVEDKEGTIRDPIVHYDAQKILFSWRKGGSEQFHLWEINVDGSGLTQLTDGKYDDIEPTYLPDGGIMFVSSRSRKWVNCWMTQVATLHRCDGDGKNVRELSANIEHDNTPWVLPDGRVLYTRWEYVDRSQMQFHQLWTMNPDGTNQMVYFGNMNPGKGGGSVFLDAKPIPGTRDVVMIDSPVHGNKQHAGWVARVTDKNGPDDLSMLTHINPSAERVKNRAWAYACGSRKMTGAWMEYRDPYPLSKEHYLVASNFKMIQMMNSSGVTTVLYRLSGKYADAGYECQEPRPLIARKRERIIPDRTDQTQTTGKLVLTDVYNGRNMKGVEPGSIKKLLILETLPKPINYSAGQEPITSGGSFTLERILGTVPVEPDGSAFMELPANRPVFFIALDQDDNAVKRMHSFTSVVPGEMTCCVGCHEERTNTPQKVSPLAPLAVRKPANKPKPIDGIPQLFDFPRDIQPILDRHCVECHNPDNRSGKVLLTGDHGPIYSHSYMMLSTRKQFIDGRNSNKTNHPPYAIGACKSPLMKMVLEGHNDVKLSEIEKKKIRFWIESAAAYPGTYASLGTGMIGGVNLQQDINNDSAWPESQKAAGVINRRCSKCHGGINREPKNLSDRTKGAVYSRDIVYNLTRPEKSVMLMAPLAKTAGGYAVDTKEKKGLHPVVFTDANDVDYQEILAMVQAGKRKLDQVKRFDMPGFKPSKGYIREMKRYGVLDECFDPDKDNVDVYQLDEYYWRHLWYYPQGKERPGYCPYNKDKLVWQ